MEKPLHDQNGFRSEAAVARTGFSERAIFGALGTRREVGPSCGGCFSVP